MDEIRTGRFLGDLLPVAHGVVLSLPLTDQTRRMIDAAAFGRMRSGAVLVDVGRDGATGRPTTRGVQATPTLFVQWRWVRTAW